MPKYKFKVKKIFTGETIVRADTAEEAEKMLHTTLPDALKATHTEYQDTETKLIGEVWPKFRCDNCGKVYYDESEFDFVLPAIPGLRNRLDPGGVVPVGECTNPKCLSLVYPIKDTEKSKIIVVLDGGLVDCVDTNMKDARVLIMDWDRKGEDELACHIEAPVTDFDLAFKEAAKDIKKYAPDRIKILEDDFFK